jgi:hypothetical protein
MKIQVFWYLTLCHSNVWEILNQWNSITSQNCLPSNTASYPRITSSVTVSHHKTTSLVTQCCISDPLTQWHSVTSQNHSPSDAVLHLRTTHPLTQCYISGPLTQWHSVTSQNHSPIDTVLHLRTTHPVTQHHIPEDMNCQKHCCETLRQFGVCMWNLDNTLLIKPLASEEHSVYFVRDWNCNRLLQ